MRADKTIDSNTVSVCEPPNFTFTFSIKKFYVQFMFNLSLFQKVLMELCAIIFDRSFT